MSGIINRLSNLLANQIAAGEVVQSPASAIKELVENSIDAGASYVIVSIKEGGKKSIQVIDDGKGMSSDDALMAFERHATSKISTVEDLFAINTFGFRGEALASIASVAEVELQTRREEDEIGIMVSINGGTFVSSEPVAYPSCGSQFVVKNLFYNIPARKKSLKTDFAETKKVIKEFEKIALCYPKVAFSLYADDKLLYMLPSTNNIRQRILSLSGKSIGKALVELYVNTSMVEVKGYIGKPEIAKKRPDTFLFVNGRYFDSPYFFKAVQNGYDKLIPDGSYVPFFLYLNVDSQSIDVNISPTKTAVKFDEEQAIWQIINAAVRESLGKNGIIPMIDFDSNTNDADMAASPVYLSTVSKEFTAYSEKLQSSPTTTYNPFNDSFSFSKAVSGKTDSFRDLSQDDKVVLTDELVDSFDTSGDIGLELDSESFTSMSEV
ncbi:MAG: DNA mismatch repair endonuclease MutL, partial [Rikenellaceae bacterium]